MGQPSASIPIWRTKGLGGGDSAPSIAAGRIFGMGNRGGDEVVWALSETDGKELWATRLGPAFKQQAPQGKEGPGCTPTVDGELLYVLGLGGAGGGLVKLSKDANGGVKAEEVYFSKKMQNHHGAMIVVDGCLYGANGGNEGGTLVCLDFKTGKVLWDGPAPGAERLGGAGGWPALLSHGERRRAPD